MEKWSHWTAFSAFNDRLFYSKSDASKVISSGTFLNLSSVNTLQAPKFFEWRFDSRRSTIKPATFLLIRPELITARWEVTSWLEGVSVSLHSTSSLPFTWADAETILKSFTAVPRIRCPQCGSLWTTCCITVIRGFVKMPRHNGILHLRRTTHRQYVIAQIWRGGGDATTVK